MHIILIWLYAKELNSIGQIVRWLAQWPSDPEMRMYINNMEPACVQLTSNAVHLSHLLRIQYDSHYMAWWVTTTNLTLVGNPRTSVLGENMQWGLLARVPCLINDTIVGRRGHTDRETVCGVSRSVTDEFPAQRVSNAENVSISWRHYVDMTTVGQFVAKDYDLFSFTNINRKYFNSYLLP